MTRGVPVRWRWDRLERNVPARERRQSPFAHWMRGEKVCQPMIVYPGMSASTRHGEWRPCTSQLKKGWLLWYDALAQHRILLSKPLTMEYWVGVRADNMMIERGAWARIADTATPYNRTQCCFGWQSVTLPCNKRLHSSAHQTRRRVVTQYIILQGEGPCEPRRWCRIWPDRRRNHCTATQEPLLRKWQRTVPWARQASAWPGGGSFSAHYSKCRR